MPIRHNPLFLLAAMAVAVTTVIATTEAVSQAANTPLQDVWFSSEPVAVDMVMKGYDSPLAVKVKAPVKTEKLTFMKRLKWLGEFVFRPEVASEKKHKYAYEISTDTILGILEEAALEGGELDLIAGYGDKNSIDGWYAFPVRMTIDDLTLPPQTWGQLADTAPHVSGYKVKKISVPGRPSITTLGISAENEDVWKLIVAILETKVTQKVPASTSVAKGLPVALSALAKASTAILGANAQEIYLAVDHEIKGYTPRAIYVSYK